MRPPAGARVLELTALTEVRREDGRVIGATVRGPEGERPVRCRWLVGADGARSRSAERLGVARPVRAPRRLGLVAHYEGVPELTESGEMHVGPGWYVGLAPLTGDRLNVGMALPLNREPTAGGGASSRRRSAACRRSRRASRDDGG